LYKDALGQKIARELLKPGTPFTIRDARNNPIQIHRQINKGQCVNLMPNLERAYNLCLEGKPEKAARVVSEIAGLLVAVEIDLGAQFIVEVEVRNTMPRLLSQIRRELKDNVPSKQVPEAESS
jgi:hypothetical protein